MAEVDETVEVMSTAGSTVEVQNLDVTVDVEDGAEMNKSGSSVEDRFLDRALTIHTELLRMLNSSSVKAPTQLKMRTELKKLMLVVMDQSNSIAFMT